MKALLFPGQGVQKVGMLDKLFTDVPEINNVIESVSKSLDFDLEDLLRNGPEDKINLTEYSQPAILVASTLIANTQINHLISTLPQDYLWESILL